VRKRASHIAGVPLFSTYAAPNEWAQVPAWPSVALHFSIFFISYARGERRVGRPPLSGVRGVRVRRASPRLFFPSPSMNGDEGQSAFSRIIPSCSRVFFQRSDRRCGQSFNEVAPRPTITPCPQGPRGRSSPLGWTRRCGQGPLNRIRALFPKRLKAKFTEFHFISPRLGRKAAPWPARVSRAFFPLAVEGRAVERPT